MKSVRLTVGDQRGVALAHVLVFAIFVVAISMGLTVMILQRYSATARTADSNSKRATDAGILARINSAWAFNTINSASPLSGYCTNFNNVDGLSCTCTRSNCACTCTCTDSGTSLPPILGACAGAYPACTSCQLTIPTAP